MGDPDRDQLHRRSGLLIAGAVTALALAACAGFWMSTQHGPVDMRGNHVVADEAAPTALPNAATPNTGYDFAVESVGLDVPLGAMNIVDDTLNPPGFTSAYLIRDKGVSIEHASDGTVFVVTHSLRNGGMAPGNYLIDVERHRSKVEVGATISVAGTDYRVTGSYPLDKKQLEFSAEVWANTPGRLVVITCLQRPDGRASTDNMVIEAREL